MFENLPFYPSTRVGNTKYRAPRINCHLFIANKIYDKTITTLHLQAIKKNLSRKIEKRILIVDDEPDVNLLFSIVLEENGFVVDSYNEGLLALENFKADMYDLAILDIKMPTINGFDLYKKIRKIDKNIKICFLTAGEINYRVFEEVYSTVEKNKFIIKPIENDQLVKKVNELLDQTKQ
jgi:CheY-like chemotaxis protein